MAPKQRKGQPQKKKGSGGTRSAAQEKAAAAALRRQDAAQQKLGKAALSEPSKEAFVDLNGIRPPIGLQNLGNTCFFNSILQVLLAVPAVQKYFTSDLQLAKKQPHGAAMRELVSRSTGANEVNVNSLDSQPAAGKAGKAGGWKRQDIYTPQPLLSAVCRKAPQFKGGQQQDSQELLVTLLAALQAEEDAVIAFRARAAAATAAVENTAAAAATTAPQDPSGPAASTIPIGPDDAQSGGTGAADTAQCPRPAQSTIAALFEGALTSTIVCGSCSHTSTTVEPFTVLSTQLANAAQDDTAGARARSSGIVHTESDAALARDARPLSAKQRKAQGKLKRKEDKLAKKRERALGLGTPPRPPNCSQGSLHNAAVVRHQPPARGALPARPALRSVSSVGSSMEGSDGSGAAQAGSSEPSAKLMARQARRAARAQEQDFQTALEAERQQGHTLSPPPRQRLTTELMASLGRASANARDFSGGDKEGDPFLRAFSHTSATPPASVMSEASEGEALEDPPAEDGQRPPPDAGPVSQAAVSSPVTIPSSYSRGASAASDASSHSHRHSLALDTGQRGDILKSQAAFDNAARELDGMASSLEQQANAQRKQQQQQQQQQQKSEREPSQMMKMYGFEMPTRQQRQQRQAMQEVTPLEQSPGGTFHVGGNLHPRLAGYLRQEEDTVSIGSDIAAPGSGMHQRRLSQDSAFSGGSSTGVDGARRGHAFGGSAGDRSDEPKLRGGAAESAQPLRGAMKDDTASGPVASTMAARPGNSTADEAGPTKLEGADLEGRGLEPDGNVGFRQGAADADTFAAQHQRIDKAGGYPEDTVPTAGAGTTSGSSHDTVGGAQQVDAGSDGDSAGSGGLATMFQDGEHGDSTAAGAFAALSLSHAKTGSGGAATTVSDCLAAFFASEDITWSCEAESKAAAAAAARTSASATDATSATEAPSPVTATPFAAVAGTSAQPPGSIDGSQTSGAAARRVRGLLSSELGSASSATTYSRKVSWSQGPHTVVMIPGSSEQRGTDLQSAALGFAPFSRPLVHNGASLLVTAQLDQVTHDSLRLQLGPHDNEITTVSLLDYTLQLGTVAIPAVQDLDSPEEQIQVAAAAQLLMDCIADIVDNHGLQGPNYDTVKEMAAGMILEVEAMDGGLVRADSLNTGNAGHASSYGSGGVTPSSRGGRMRVIGHMPAGLGPEGSQVWEYPDAPRRTSMDMLSPLVVARRSYSVDSVDSSASLALSSSSGSVGGASSSAEGSSPVAVNSRTGAQLGDFSIRRATQSSKDGGGLSEDAGLLLSSSGSGHDDSTALTLPQSLVHAATGALTLANRGGSDAVLIDESLLQAVQSLPTVPEATPSFQDAAAAATADHTPCGPSKGAQSASRVAFASGAPSARPAVNASYADTAGVSHHPAPQLAAADSAAQPGDSAGNTTVNFDAVPRIGDQHSKDGEARATKASLEQKPSSAALPSALRGGSIALKAPLRAATKTYAIRDPPPLLTLHLKRFEQDKRGMFRKVSRRVAFDFHLDITSHSHGAEALRYQLAGVVEHVGTMMRSGMLC